MIVKDYKNPHNWFQVGWNTFVTRSNLPFALTKLDSWDLCDFLGGFASAVYRQTLPNHWLE